MNLKDYVEFCCNGSELQAAFELDESPEVIFDNLDNENAHVAKGKLKGVKK